THLVVSMLPVRTAIYPVSLHDALPIYHSGACIYSSFAPILVKWTWLKSAICSSLFSLLIVLDPLPFARPSGLSLQLSSSLVPIRSEEHTSELQSRENLVCRLLLEKKKE